MKIMVDVNHPAQVHFFRYFVREMKARGHQVLITASEKEVSLKLLNNFGYEYVNMGSYGNNMASKFINVPLMDIKMFNAIRHFGPDIIIGLGSIRAAHASFLLRKPCLSIEDTECSPTQINLYLPFVKAVFTPSDFKFDLGKKQIRVKANKEMAYLHPHYFRPDPSVLDHIGIKEGERLILIRFISWGASHDVGQHGIADRVAFVKALEGYGKILISSENELEAELQKYKLSLPPESLHSLLYYATLYIGEGGTTASEAALLGTHSVLIDPTAKQCGVFYDLNKHDLLWFLDSAEEGLDVARKLLADPDIKAKGREKLNDILKERIDMTRFLIWVVENYPKSIADLHKDPTLQDQFK